MMSCLYISVSKVEQKEERELLQESTSEGGVKRKRTTEGDPKSKLSKAGVHACTSKTVSESKDENSKASDLESQLEMQTRMLWALKDDLKKHVATSELREMLEENNQDSKGSELDLRERW